MSNNNSTSALQLAYQLQVEAANLGFDWPNVKGAIAKVEEELDEVYQELNMDNLNIKAAADELGDLYFAVTNVVRHLGLCPEEVLNGANNKFSQRFNTVKNLAEGHSIELSEMTLEQLNALWEQSKAIHSAR